MNALLAFDTATEHLSIALEVRGRVLTHEGPGGAQASSTLIPSILALLARAGIGLRGLDAIAFGRGPGAFTGLRTACAVAQGLAWGADIPVLPVDTLLAVAQDARHRHPQMEAARVWSVLDARMNEVYAAHYAFDACAWSTIDAPRLLSAEALNRHWRAETPQAVAGNALTAFAGQLMVEGARCIPEAAPRATAMLTLARAQWERGGAVDPALALPLYLRDKVALTTHERDAARTAKTARAALP